MKNLDIGERMKYNYEQPYLLRFPLRMPLIIRIDGKGFHQFTKNMKKPFDNELIDRMALLSKYMYDNLQGVVLTYCQSDEISILVHNYKKLESQSPYNNELQKLVSITAGMASAYFSNLYGKIAIFDSRAFVLPEQEVCNYFIWRQLDAVRNSISMVANSLYSHKQLHKKNSSDKQEMIFAKGQNWNDYPTHQRRGFCVRNGEIDLEIPEFTKDRAYIEDLLTVRSLTIEDMSYNIKKFEVRNSKGKVNFGCNRTLLR